MSELNVVVMFPYPSGKGLHVGHFYNYAIIDSYCRYRRYMGDKVNQPFGYDAFGLPAENYARQVGRDPRDVTYENINRFRHQMIKMNTQYKEHLITSDLSYYKWTQWLFLKLLDHDLAYKADSEVNYCNKCQTVLANEQVKSGKCDRCESVIQIKKLNQWFFKITNYKQRLIDNIKWIDYPDSTKKLQLHWLHNLRDWCVSRQRKWGCPIPISGEEDTLDTFVDSSFYYLRYLTDSSNQFLPSGCYKPIDLYVGGPEHACMHLIYARFIHMFLYDIGVVPQEEPFNKVIHQGMITFNNAKMSKSKSNTIDPDDFDPDCLRMGLMFLGPYQAGGEWNEKIVIGIGRFLNKFRTWLSQSTDYGEDLNLSELFQNIDRCVNNWKFNKVVSSFMEFFNHNKNKIPSLKTRDDLLKMLTNFAPGFKLN